MTLQEKLSSRKSRFEASAPPEVLSVMHRATEELRNSGIMDAILKAGDKAPAYRLPNAKGEEVSSKDLLSKSLLVISFYRGKW